jgi:predicted nucleic acid-binding Zn ribbon protein
MQINKNQHLKTIKMLIWIGLEILVKPNLKNNKRKKEITILTCLIYEIYLNYFYMFN